MDYSKLPIFAMMQEQMKYSAARQATLAKNIANADTPKYVPYDIKPPAFSSHMKKQSGGLLPMAVTNTGHMKGAAGSAGAFRPMRDKVTEMSPNGNAVMIEDQMLKLQQNSGDYQTTTSLYRKMTGLFRTALGDNNS